MLKRLLPFFLAIASLSVSSAQNAEGEGEGGVEKKAKEDLGYIYLLPLAISSLQSVSESEKIGALLPSTLVVDPGCIPAKIRRAMKNKEAPYTLQLNESKTSKPILINKAFSSHIIFDALDAEGKPAFKWEIKPPASKEALTLVFSNPKSKDRWVNPSFKTIDCSAEKMPDGSVVVLNFSHNVLHTQIGKQKHIIKKGEKKVFKAPPTDKLALSVVAKNGKRKAFLYRNYIKSKKGHRRVIIVYPKPASGAYLKVAISIADIPLIPTRK